MRPNDPIYSTPSHVTAKPFQETHLGKLQAHIAQKQHMVPLAHLKTPHHFPLPVITKQFVKLEAKVNRQEREGETSETSKKEGDERKIMAIKQMENASERFHEQNQELESHLLVLLRNSIKNGDTKEEILAKVRNAYSDLSLADEALDFLIETSDGELRETLRAAKKDLNERYGVDIRAGRNIGATARQFAQQELGSPTALRDMYREMISNPREAAVLFEELSKEFPFKKMKTVIEFLLHSTGADLRSKGPSLSRGELHNIMAETRNMQAILGIYRFFQARMKMIHSSFTRHGISVPHKLTFELIARMFMKFLGERYPSADKALMLARELGISDSTLAEIIIYTQMRDGVRQIAPRLFKSEQHKHDVLMALIAALEQLDEELEEQGQEPYEDEEEEDDEIGKP